MGQCLTQKKLQKRMQIVTILPISRPQYLERVLASLGSQTYPIDTLVAIFDGDDKDFVATRNKVVESIAGNVLFVRSTNLRPAFSIPDRRRHITNIHNQFRQIIGTGDWVFSVEDDGVLPATALENLVDTMQGHRDIGMVTGVELGRWGVQYVGAWRVDNVFTPTNITSMENKTGQGLIEPIDACGLYCGLIRLDMYKQHEFVTDNGLGPDVNLGLFLRQQGLNNLIDWRTSLTHLTNRAGVEMEIPATDRSRVVTLRLLSGSTWQAATR